MTLTGKRSREQAGIKPMSAALETDPLTTRTTRQSYNTEQGASSEETIIVTTLEKRVTLTT